MHTRTGNRITDTMSSPASSLPVIPQNSPVSITTSADLNSTFMENIGDEAWQKAMRQAIRDPDDLISRLGLSDELRPAARRAAEKFPLLVPPSYLERIQYGNPFDPLLRQVLPLAEEEVIDTGFELDAVGDLESRTAPGLLKKYDGRALLITTGLCAIHCRYCFRRHYAYGSEPRRLTDWGPAREAIQADPSIHELILSGGDPLMLSDRRMEELVAQFETIPHLKRLRIHSRLPVVLPERVTTRLVHWMQNLRLTPYMVVHANHPQEIVTDCASRLRMLVRSGITVLNQTVLLRGINDDEEVLVSLNERLINLGVIPYYLHQLDRVAGAAHFEVPKTRGLDLMAKLRRRLPGYAVPEYVEEIRGEAHKVPIWQP